MPRTTITIRLAACAAQPLRRSLHRRGDVVRRIEDLIEDGLQDLSRFTPGRRRTDPKATVTRTTVRLDTVLLARLNAAVQPLGTTRAALIEAMIEAKWQEQRQPSPPSEQQQAPPPDPRRLLCIHLDPVLEQQFRQQYIRYRGDVSKHVTAILYAGLAAIERFAPVPRRRPKGQNRLLMVTLEVELLARLTAAAKAVGASRAALIEAMIEARLRGEI